MTSCTRSSSRRESRAAWERRITRDGDVVMRCEGGEQPRRGCDDHEDGEDGDGDEGNGER